MIHHIKTVQPFFDAVDEDKKTCELRKNDRDYKAGDFLFLHEYDPANDSYSGKVVPVNITHVLADYEGLQPGYCIISFVKMEV